MFADILQELVEKIKGKESEYLRNLQIHKAMRVIFVGDGASWIWNRVQ